MWVKCCRFKMKNNFIKCVMAFAGLCFLAGGFLAGFDFEAEACDVAVVSAAASSTGRPVIWKSRDNAESYREEVKYYPEVNANAGGSIRVMGEVVYNGGAICSAGVNEAGFAICNTTVYEDIWRESRNKNTDMMVDAIEQCDTLSSFEARVSSNWADKTLCGNFAVMDAHGGVALYEIWTDDGTQLYMARYNASDYGGFVNRTNSHQWDQQTSDTARELRGRQIFTALNSGNIGDVLGSHKDRLNALIYDDVYNVSLNYRTVMQLVAKDVCYGDCTTYDDCVDACGEPPCPLDPGSIWPNCGACFWDSCTDDLSDPSSYQTRFCISRYQTQFSFVVEGVNEGEDPALVTAWVALGEPSFTVSTPHFAVAGQVTPYAVDDQYYTDSWQTATGSNTWDSDLYPQTRSSDDYSFFNLASDWFACPNSNFLYSNNGVNTVDNGGYFGTDRTIKFNVLLTAQNWIIPIETFLIEKYEDFKIYLSDHPGEITPENLYNFSHISAEYAYRNYIQRSSSAYPWEYDWDEVYPWVESVSPAENAVNVSPNSVITAEFSEEINQSTLNGSTFTVNDGSGNISGSISYASGSFTGTFTPAVELCYSNNYTATVTTGVEDTSGNELNSAKNWSFETMPLIAAVNPPDSMDPVQAPSVVTITFNPSVAVNSGTITTSNIKLYNDTAATWVTGTVSYNSGNKTATFTPASALDINTQYTCTVTTGVKDTVGAGLKNPFSWTFVSAADTTPPQVISTSVYNGQISVPLSVSFTATFSEAMDEDTINEMNIIIFNEDSEEYIAGSVSYNESTKTAVFDPAESFTYKTNYTLRIGTGVKDESGNSLASEKIVAFKTKLDTDPPVVVAAPPSGLIAIPEVISIVFDEAMDPDSINNSTVHLYNENTMQLVSGSVTYDEITNTVTFVPDDPLDGNTEYTFIISQDVQDINGTNISTQLNYTFTTIPDPSDIDPVIDDTDPDLKTLQDFDSGGCGCGAAANAAAMGSLAPVANLLNVFANIILPLLLVLGHRCFRRRRKRL